MKNIFLILITVCFISCKDKIKPKDPHMEIGYSSADTSISQEIWYYQNGYVLQTVARTWKGQQIMSKYGHWLLLGNSPSIVPYMSEILGSFDYIKNNKAIEYNKAQHFIDSIRPIGDSNKIIQTKKDIAEKAIKDSVELLKNIPIITTSPGGTNSLHVIYDSTKL